MLHKKQFGLIGKNISYSFSKKYFTEKLKNLNITDKEYVNFDIPKIEDFLSLDFENILGCNVTIPYKKQIIPFLDEIEQKALRIGAVNTIKIAGKKLIGYNTDVYGFEKSIQPLLEKHHKKALILGTGGASKAISYVFDKFDISYLLVSRTESKGNITYSQLSQKILEEYKIIVNCTPLGTYPNVENEPKIPYKHITNKHLLYDLIYNPAETKFLKKGSQKGATTKNGYEMLVLQAEKSWKIWDN